MSTERDRVINIGPAVKAVYVQGVSLAEVASTFFTPPLSPEARLVVERDILYAKIINNAVDRIEASSSDRPPYGLLRCINDGFTEKPGTVVNLERDFVVFREIPSLVDKEDSKPVPEDFYTVIGNLTKGLKHTMYHSLIQEYREGDESMLKLDSMHDNAEDSVAQVYRGMGTADEVMAYTLQLVFERFEFHVGRRPTFGEFKIYAQNSTGYLLSNMANNMENLAITTAFINGIYDKSGAQVLDIDQEKERLVPIRPAYDLAVEDSRTPTMNPKVVCPAAFSTIPGKEVPVIRLYQHLINALT